MLRLKVRCRATAMKSCVMLLDKEFWEWYSVSQGCTLRLMAYAHPPEMYAHCAIV